MKKAVILFLLCTMSLTGCNKNRENTATSLINTEMDESREDVAVDDVPTEINLSTLKNMELSIDEEKVAILSMDFGTTNLIVGTHKPTGNSYTEFMGNKFIYQDGVNYYVSEDTYHKYAGDNVSNPEEGSYTEVSSAPTINLEEILAEMEIESFTLEGDIAILNARHSENNTPIILKIDVTTQSIVYIEMSNESGLEITAEFLDDWNVLPDVEFVDVDKDTMQSNYVSINMAMLGVIAGGIMYNDSVYEEIADDLEESRESREAYYEDFENYVDELKSKLEENNTLETNQKSEATFIDE